METYFKKGFNGAGSKQIRKFVSEIEKAFFDKLVQYANHRISHQDTYKFEHGFYYGERQTKSYLTAAIDKVCTSDFMQEYKVDRVKRRNDSITDEGLIGNGAIDYWCRYGKSSKISVLIEVKQSWIRYHNDNKSTVYAYSTKIHDEAIKQIKSVKDKCSYCDKNLYGIAVTILPIFRRFKTDNAPYDELSDDDIKKIALQALKKLNGHACGALPFSKKIAKIDNWPDVRDENKTIFENHPGIVTVWSIFKYTRK